MNEIRIPISLLVIVFRAVKVRYLRKYSLFNKEDKLELVKRISDGLIEICHFAQTTMEKKGEIRYLTETNGDLSLPVLQNIIGFRMHCLKEDESRFSRVVAGIFTEYAKLTEAEQTCLRGCKLVLVDGRVAVEKLTNSPAPDTKPLQVPEPKL